MRIVLALIFAVSLISAKSGDLKFTPKNLAEVKTLPTDGAETVEMIKQGAILNIRSSITDTLDRIWYMVKIFGTEKGGFVLGSDIEPVSDDSDTLLSPRIKKEVSADKKRRMAIVKKNTDWSRRIKSALLAGTICLGMNREQLTASWESPDNETDGFILGAGEVRILFYRKEDPVAVVVKNGEVIGWSEKKR
jgi:hypothetical protein